MKLVRCRKCGTAVTTIGTFQERSLDEISGLRIEIEKITYSMSKYKMNSPKWLQLLEIRREKRDRIREIETMLNKLEKQLRVQERNSKEQFFTDILVRELLSHGYTREHLEEFNKQAEAKWRIANKELERIYGGLNGE